MSDLIDRQAAIAEFRCCELTPDGGIDANYAIDFLKQLPSAQPKKRTEKWIKEDDEGCWWYECSECGDYPLKNAYGHDVLSDFCPNCGAKMEG